MNELKCMFYILHTRLVENGSSQCNKIAVFVDELFMSSEGVRWWFWRKISGRSLGWELWRRQLSLIARTHVKYRSQRHMASGTETEIWNCTVVPGNELLLSGWTPVSLFSSLLLSDFRIYFLSAILFIILYASLFLFLTFPSFWFIFSCLLPFFPNSLCDSPLFSPFYRLSIISFLIIYRVPVLHFFQCLFCFMCLFYI